MAEATAGAHHDSWTIGRVLDWAARDFKERGFESPRLDAELLLGRVLGVDRVRLIVDAARPLEPSELSAFRAMIRRRRNAEPIAYILEEREFYGLPFRVDARVLVPRPDTESLVDVALQRSRHLSQFGRLLDLCTGSGCVAVAFSRARPTWRVTATDVSKDAVAVARDNAHRLGAISGVRILHGDLDTPITSGERFDLVTANPPYIPTGDLETLQPDVRDHEPRLALDGGADGLDIIRRVLEVGRDRLEPRGILAVEVGASQAGAVTRLFADAGFTDLEQRRDYGGIERVVSGRKPHA